MKCLNLDKTKGSDLSPFCKVQAQSKILFKNKARSLVKDLSILSFAWLCPTQLSLDRYLTPRANVFCIYYSCEEACCHMQTLKVYTHKQVLMAIDIMLHACYSIKYCVYNDFLRSCVFNTIPSEVVMTVSLRKNPEHVNNVIKIKHRQRQSGSA